MRLWKHDVCKPQLVQHGAHDWLAAVCCPGRFGPDPEAIPPGGKAEAPMPKESLKFDRMFPAGLITGRILRKCAERQPELFGDKADQQFRRVFT
jgi:hypothetical protein